MTKHQPTFCSVVPKCYKDGTPVLKLTAVVDYKNAKMFINIGDQIKSCGSVIGRRIKWYREVFVELLCNTTVVNAYIFYIAKKT